MKNVIVSLVALAGVASIASAQITQEPVGASLRYEVAVNGGAWSSSVNANPGDRVEWRAVLNINPNLQTPGLQPVAALGSIFYQPVIVNADITGAGASRDNLGAWRNNGISGQGNTTLAQGLLSVADGNNSGALSSYGRVRFGFTSRSTTTGSSGGLTGFDHAATADTDINGLSASGGFGLIRIAGANNPNWYPASIPAGSVALNNQILWGVVSDNPAVSSTWFLAGTQNLVLFRQSLTLSDNTDLRQICLTSEAATLFRAGGGAGTDDLRFMRSAGPGEGSSNASIRNGVEYIAGCINVVPTPGAVALLGLGGLVAGRRRRA